MFERFLLASSLERINKRFSVTQMPAFSYIPSYTIKQGQTTIGILQGQSHQFQQLRYGLTTCNKTQYFIRAEGNRNKNDDPEYAGSKAIFLIPDYKKLIRFQRCLILADAFIVETMNKQPYLVHLMDKNRPFAFAGLYSMDSSEYSFVVITVPANPLLSHLGQKRMPVILHARNESKWLKDSTILSEVLNALKPYPDKLMNAYPIDRKYLENGVNDASVVKPAGQPVYKKQTEFYLQSGKQKKTFTGTTSFADRLKFNSKF